LNELPESRFVDFRSKERKVRLALTLGGGGARAAYQVGVLRAVARRNPELQIDLLNGVSAGAINVSHLANFEGNLKDSADALADLWLGLHLENVFRTQGYSLLWRLLRIGMRLSIGLPGFFEQVHGMVDTSPLRQYLCGALNTSDGSLPGISRNLASGRLKGVALTANSYATGDTVSFFGGQAIDEWERPNRRSVETLLNVDHIMASSALPLFFPPIEIDEEWYGDGGIRLIAPLGPAVHMGASHVMVISTHFQETVPSTVRQNEPPSPATVLAEMYNSMFLDQLDQDVRQMERTNLLLPHVESQHRHGLREVGLLVIRPSQNLGELAFDLKNRLPPTLRYLLNRFGGSQSGSDDFLSTLMFHPDYVRRLIEIGESDAEAQADQIDGFLNQTPPSQTSHD